ncbi:JAB domain-containing protein [Bacillus sp. SCS-151]|uniref:JAB domain-containing protein n=1 Tax=Nanhaiella sioensis TaxID=3115293 RepID=UPI00397D5F33
MLIATSNRHVIIAIIVTKRLVEVGKIVGIDLLDHIIICNPRYYSLNEEIEFGWTPFVRKSSAPPHDLCIFNLYK